MGDVDERGRPGARGELGTDGERQPRTFRRRSQPHQLPSHKPVLKEGLPRGSTRRKLE